MQRNPIYIYGAIIILEGLFLLFSSFDTIKYTIGISLIVGSLLALLKALSRQRKQIEFAYYEMNLVAIFVYGAIVLLFCSTQETLLLYTTFLFFFYAFSEIIFCFRLFNLGRVVIYKIVFVCLTSGLIVGIAPIFITNNPEVDITIQLEGFRLLFILIGIVIILYIPILKAKELKEFT